MHPRETYSSEKHVCIAAGGGIAMFPGSYVHQIYMTHNEHRKMVLCSQGPMFPSSMVC